MRYAVLAAGFDGTLARDGRCERRSVATLRALAASGHTLILTTSRQLRDLLDVFPEASLFDYLIAENGAVVHRPAARESAILAPAPSEVLIHELKRRGVEPLSIGSVVVTVAASCREFLAQLIERLRLECHLLEDGRTISVVPNGVSKATGVQHALDDLGLSARNLVAIGDAENDVALLDLAEHGVAVANGTTALKQVADRVTRAPHAEGFEELARDLLDTDLYGAPTRRRIVLGTRGGQQPIAIAPAQTSILLTGPAASGKAALCNSMLTQYLAQTYQCCIFGAYPARAASEGDADLHVCGDEQTAPKAADVLTLLEQPTQSVVVNLAAIRVSARAAYVEQLLAQLAPLQARVGRPHAIVFDQAEALLNMAGTTQCARLRGANRIYLTAQPEHLPRALLDSVDVVVALGDGTSVWTHVRGRGSQTEIPPCESDRACVWFRDSGTAPFNVDLDLKGIVTHVIPESPPVSNGATRPRAARIEDNAAAMP